MASGYEKADCGMDPNDGWGEPTRIEEILLLIGAVVWFVFSTWQMLSIFLDGAAMILPGVPGR